MSWVKKQFNKFFKMDPDADYVEYEDEHQADDNDALSQNRRANTQYEEQKRFQEMQQQQSKSFRFPLIEDDRASAPAPAAKQTTSYYDEEKETLNLPNHLRKQTVNPVNDVDVSGIRDLLERRRKGRGHSNVIRSEDDNPRKLSVSKVEREEVSKSSTREERKVNQEFTNPLANRKRFVPTEVPSPVHGFLKPTPIEQLIENQHRLHKESPEEQQSILKEAKITSEQVATVEGIESQQAVKKEPIIEPQAIQEASQITEPVIEAEAMPIEAISDQVEESNEQPQEGVVIKNNPILFEINELETVATESNTTSTTYSDVEAPSILVDEVAEIKQANEQEPSVAELLNDVQVKHVTIEHSTIHIGQLNVEQLPKTEQEVDEYEEDEATPLQPIEPFQRENSGSRVPFNVVMLKSDKQKLLTKKFVMEQLHHQQSEEAATEEDDLSVSIQGTNTIVIEAQTPAEQHGELESPQQVVWQEEQVAQVEQVDEAMDTSPIVEQVIFEKDIVNEIINEPNAIVVEPVISEIDSSLLRQSSTPVNAYEQMQQFAQTSVAVETLEREEHLIEEVIEIDTQPEIVKAENVEEDIQQPIIPSDSMIELEAPTTTVQQVQQPVQLEIPVEPEKKRIPYVKPPLEYLVPPEEMVEDRAWMDEQGENLVESLSYFQIQANIESIVQGPAVTQFEITVGQGTKVSKVRNLADDIKLALAAKDIRIDAPIPGKRSIGIEIPNRISRSVRLSEVTDSDSFRNSDSPLEAALGLDLTGKPVTIDLRKMPHGLIAGATGSGKSVCINSILVSLLYKANPNELKLMLIDPKMVELAPFNHIPHLVSPVITDVKAATAALKWAVEEMERRYQLFMHSGARKIEAYNKMCDENGMYAQKLPYLLIVIDELADLMMMSPQDVEDSIVRITQKARAAGIHLIVATQRPSVDVITGLIKSNIPTRIAFSVSSQIDSRTILDAQGAERLLGRGDMLYLGNGMSAPTRIQGTFVTDDEIEEIIEFVREQGEPEYIFKQEELLKRTEAVEEQDELFEEVCRFVFEQGSASTSLLQRRYHIGYNRAARLIDMLEKQGYVSEPKGSKPRDVYITEEDIAVQFGD